MKGNCMSCGQPNNLHVNSHPASCIVVLQKQITELQAVVDSQKCSLLDADNLAKVIDEQIKLNQIDARSAIADMLEAKIAELSTGFGLMIMRLGHKTTLLNSCESALSERDSNISELQTDADRYRYLRDENNGGEDTDSGGWDELGLAHAGEFDAIVDERMQHATEVKGGQ